MADIQQGDNLRGEQALPTDRSCASGKPLKQVISILNQTKQSRIERQEILTMYISILIFTVLFSLGNCQVCNPPCQNNATCLAGNACQCKDGSGWSGYRCEIALCTAYANQCGPGRCVSPNVCNCTGTGYTGPDCSHPICQVGCANGGRCIAPNTCDCANTGYTGQYCDIPVCNAPIGCGPGDCVAPEVCNCTDGWTGKYCTQPICEVDCMNNGTCVGPDACECKGTGFTGQYCEIPVCEPLCENAGRCVVPNVCDCTSIYGWIGDRCEIPVCNQPCLNGGFCSGPNECNCANTGYGGKRCELEVNECLATPSPCDPIATCNNLPGNFTCTCPVGYTGTGKVASGGCQDIDECSRSICHILTECINLNGTYECGPCPEGYSGNGKDGCVPICDPPCQNNGTCKLPNKCVCDGYTGNQCETDIDECANSNSCDALVTCTNLPGSYECGACPEGYEGDGYTGCRKTQSGSTSGSSSSSSTSSSSSSTSSNGSTGPSDIKESSEDSSSIKTTWFAVLYFICIALAHF